jgi:N-glycosylase/DNA lyase
MDGIAARAHFARKILRQIVKYDKTSRSKDVIIEAKDKRIAKLEAENRKLRIELEQLRGLLYG